MHVMQTDLQSLNVVLYIYIKHNILTQCTVYAYVNIA